MRTVLNMSLHRETDKRFLISLQKLFRNRFELVVNCFAVVPYYTNRGAYHSQKSVRDFENHCDLFAILVIFVCFSSIIL